MVRTISSLEGMRSLFAEANAFPTGSFEGSVVVVSVDKLSHAGAMVQLMESLISLGWQFEGEVVLRRLARADAFLVQISDEPLQVFLNNPRAPNVVKDLRRVGWKLNRVSKLYGDRGRARTRGVPVLRQPMLNRVGNTLRRLAGHASNKTKPVEYIQGRIRLLREEVIPACRASSVLVQTPLPPPLPQPSALPPPRPQQSSSPTSAGSTSTTSSTSTARSSTPSTAGGSSSWSDGSYNSNCSRCVEGRPHGNYQVPLYPSSSSTEPSSGSSG